MRRQRNIFQTKVPGKTPDKRLSGMKIGKHPLTYFSWQRPLQESCGKLKQLEPYIKESKAVSQIIAPSINFVCSCHIGRSVKTVLNDCRVDESLGYVILFFFTTST